MTATEFYTRRYDYVDTYHRREAQAITDYVNGELR
jgi:hypothetical protein